MIGIEPKCRPILMSGGMVCRILDGRKTQTRRVFDDRSGRRKDGAKLLPELLVQLARTDGGYGSLCPYGRPGDQLWVRETWARATCRDGSTPPGRPWIYRADGESCYFGGIWSPSIHMPRRASRLTLDVVSVRLEPLQVISPEDCFAEGLEDPDGRYGWYPEACRAWYRDLWEKLHGPGSWALNPWVWAVEFRPIAAEAVA